MRKMLFICMGLGLLVTSIATASDVVSTNIVGYQQDKGRGASTYMMAGAIFTPVLNPLGKHQFSKFVTGDFQAGDQVQFLLPNGSYNILTYYVDNLWVEVEEDVWEDHHTGWGQFQTLADQELTAGTAFWIKTNVKYTQAGQVQDPINNEVDVKGGKYQMICPPFPVNYNLSDVVFDGIQAGDQVQFLLPNGSYNILTYYVGNLWVEVEEDVWEDDHTGWGQFQTLADQEIVSGTGFWIYASGDVTVKFTAPTL